MTARRRCLQLLACALAPAAPWALAATAPLPRVGLLLAGSRPDADHPNPDMQTFLDCLRELGHEDGKTIEFDWFCAGGDYARLPALAQQLAHSGAVLAVAFGTDCAKAMHGASSTLPVVFVAVTSPVSLGLVASLAHPGGNMTGTTTVAVELGLKQLELIAELVPRLRCVGLIVNPGNLFHPILRHELAQMAQRLGIRVVAAGARDGADFAPAYAALKRKGAGAVVVAADILFQRAGPQIAAAANATRLPTISLFREHVREGTLISYGVKTSEMYRRGADYAHRVLRGAPPSELPVYEPSDLLCTINLGTARRLGLHVPQAVRLRADAVLP